MNGQWLKYQFGRVTPRQRAQANRRQPQAIYDMGDDAAKQRLVDKRRIRKMRHQARIRHLDFTPVMIVGGASVDAMQDRLEGRGASRPDPSPVRTRRAQLRQRAQDKILHVTMWRG